MCFLRAAKTKIRAPKQRANSVAQKAGSCADRPKVSILLIAQSDQYGVTFYSRQRLSSDLMEKIVIGTKEIGAVELPRGEAVHEKVKLELAIGWGARIGMSPLVLILPVLCLVTLAMRLAMRGLPPRTRYAWTSFLSSLLVVSGIINSAAVAVAIYRVPQTASLSKTLAELDSRASYPSLPSKVSLSARDVSSLLTPLVEVISPVEKSWFGSDRRSSAFGAGVLLGAGNTGYLIATARHITGEPPSQGDDAAFVTMESGKWARAEIVARHETLDLALLWLPRDAGKEDFVLPIRSRNGVGAGESVFVIGHPQGLRFTLSTGIVSRADRDTIQISAPVSPGNSGGPVFDDHGNLVAIVTSMVDRSNNPNAENLNFSVPADAATMMEGWQFANKGQQRLQRFLEMRTAKRTLTGMF